MNAVSFVVGAISSILFIGFVPYKYGVPLNIWQAVLGVSYTLLATWIGQKVFNNYNKGFIGYLVLVFVFPFIFFVVTR